ncbi:MAG TPA: hypothetical protein VES97_07230 [Solirubrobacteraceae bacterium]|nr:hypothetical protein [Solirubrobacteraceae bacterium]
MSGAARDGGAEAALAPYEAIRRHAELELELAGRGELDRLAAMGERWGELTGDLPARPPAGAGPLLEGANLIHERTRIELIRLREALMSDLATATQARRTVDGYAGQLRGRPHVDHSA